MFEFNVRGIVYFKFIVLKIRNVYFNFELYNRCVLKRCGCVLVVKRRCIGNGIGVVYFKDCYLSFWDWVWSVILMSWRLLDMLEMGIVYVEFFVVVSGRGVWRGRREWWSKWWRL